MSLIMKISFTDTGSVQVLEVLESYGKQKYHFPELAKLWKRERIFKMATKKFWIFVSKNSKNILKWMLLCVILNTVYVTFVLLHPHRNYKIYHQKQFFSIIIGFQSENQNELNGFGNLVFWHWKSQGNYLKEFVQTLLIASSSNF